jgi:hypothetical protein
VNTLSRLASKQSRSPGVRMGKVLSEDARFSELTELVRLNCESFEGRSVANVLHGLAVLQADVGVESVDATLGEQLFMVVEREAGGMNSQGVANTLNALSKLDAAAGAMRSSGWRALAQAVESTAPTMIAQGVGNTLNALRRLDAAAGAIGPSGWGALAKAVEARRPR